MPDNEFSADKEFFSNYLTIKELLIANGWKETHPIADKRSIASLYIKNGYGLYILYGCEEEIKNELL
jgi:hypothetical protein